MNHEGLKDHSFGMKSLENIATGKGIIAAIAMDQRRSLRRMIAASAGLAETAVPDAQLQEFKVAVTAVLSPLASAVLLDPEYGEPAMASRAPGCALLATYESDGYDNQRPHRMLALMPKYSVTRLREKGAQGVKILLSWAPDDDQCANDEKRVLIERVGRECTALGLPFLLEPVVYDPAGGDPRGPEFAARKPRLVCETMREFSDPPYGVDVLKVEFPVIAAFVENSPVFNGTRVHGMDEALSWFREADAAAGCPYIYLSAGVSIDEFIASLGLAAASGARFSGVLCGRAAWQDGIPVYTRGGATALLQWLESQGQANFRRILGCLEAAAPWWEKARRA